MATMTKTITRCTSLLVALGILLGLAVTGCSHHDHSDGRIVEKAEIEYIFAIMTGTPKATLTATNVVLSAFDAYGNAVDVKQNTKIIAEHKNITEAGVLGASYYAGHAHINNNATKLVLTYFDKNGKEVGTADVIDNIELEDGTFIDFSGDVPTPTPTPVPPTPTPTVDVTWTPAKADCTIAEGEELPITAKDGDVELTVRLALDSEEFVTVSDHIITGLKNSEDVATVVEAIAFNEAGDYVASNKYEIKVIAAPVPDFVWSPEADNITLSLSETGAPRTQNVTYTDSTGNTYDIEFEISDEVSTYIDVDYEGNITAKQATSAPVQCKALALDENWVPFAEKTYLVTVTE